MQNPDEIKIRLDNLIQEAKPVFPRLASRLDEMRRWIIQKKPGLLMRKKHVILLLAELVEDTTFWLSVQSLPDDDRDTLLSELSPAEQYWYKDLFPSWFNEEDPKLAVWKQNLMSDNFDADDADCIKKICRYIDSSGGCTHNPYIADLSMATDLIVSGSKDVVLCVQVTSVQGTFCDDKCHKWKSTLQYWGIRRGLFVSFNTSRTHLYRDVAQTVLRDSDQLPERCYVVKNDI